MTQRQKRCDARAHPLALFTFILSSNQQMLKGLNRRRLAIALMGTAITTMVACSDNSLATDPSRPLAPSASARHDELPPGDGPTGGILVCKDGGPAGRYYFTISTAGGGDFYGPEV